MKSVNPVMIVAAALILSGCADTPELAAERERRRSPISIRGWIWDVEAPAPTVPGTLSVVGELGDQERKARIFQQTYISIDNVTYASGGLIDTGAFVILDAPPRNLTMLIQTPVFTDYRIPMQRIPPNADVYLPGIVLDAKGVHFAEPEKLRVRIPGEKSGPTGETALIGGHEVPIETATISELVNRREYPEITPPESAQPSASAQPAGAAAPAQPLPGTSEPASAPLRRE